MKYAYFPGCALHSTAREYDMSTKEVASCLGIELVEIPDWICCGATPAHITLHLLSLSLPVKTLIQAKQMDSYEVAVCCAACFNRLKVANKMMSEDPEHRKKVNEILNSDYQGEVGVKHFLDILVNEYGLDSLAKKISKKLVGLKVACYYGCLLTRLPEVTELDDLEEPRLMDDLVSSLGAEAVNWPYKTECCGAALSLTKTDVVIKLSHDILEMAKDAGADVVAVACPLCQSNLDLRQREVERRYKMKFGLPILYFTQLAGLSLGIEPKKLGLNKHMVDPMRLLGEKGLV